MAETTRELAEIDGQEESYQLTLSRTNHNQRWSATVHYDGKERYISQNLLVSDPGSETAMRVLAENAFRDLYQELHPAS